MYTHWLKQLEHNWTAEGQAQRYQTLFGQPFTEFKRPRQRGQPGRSQQHPNVMSGLHTLFNQAVAQKTAWGAEVARFEDLTDFTNPPDLKTRARY